MDLATITYFILSIAGGLLGMLALTYIFTLITDRFCCGRVDPDRLYTPVSNKANLWGLNSSERRAVLEKVFSNKIQKYQEKNQQASNSRFTSSRANTPLLVEDEPGSSDNKKQKFSSDTGNPNGDTVANEGSPGILTEEKTRSDCLAPEVSEDNLEYACAICLVKYESGDDLIAGASCKHCLYHYDCIMQWMQKGHDFCPYCRKEMMTAQDMRSAALEVLGEQRVNQVSLSASTWWSRPVGTQTTNNETNNLVISEIQMSDIAPSAERRQQGDGIQDLTTEGELHV